MFRVDLAGARNAQSRIMVILAFRVDFCRDPKRVPSCVLYFVLVVNSVVLARCEIVADWFELLRRDADFVPAKNVRFALVPFSEYDQGAGEIRYVWS